MQKQTVLKPTMMLSWKHKLTTVKFITLVVIHYRVYLAVKVDTRIILKNFILHHILLLVVGNVERNPGNKPMFNLSKNYSCESSYTLLQFVQSSTQIKCRKITSKQYFFFLNDGINKIDGFVQFANAQFNILQQMNDLQARYSENDI